MGERIPDVSQRVAERVEEVRSETGVDGRTTLRRRRFGAVKARMVAAAGVPADLTVHLDPLGTAAWRLIDGRRTVGEIRVELLKANPTEPDIGARLGKFLGAMVSNGFVRLR
ncbi:MAG: hypothetical protein QOC71_116 [Thermoplasmata archaeon]|nr:hypothetical protein [Thermoplasmata archaeon]